MLRGSMANGSPNDAIMCELIGDNWKELTGCDLGVRLGFFWVDVWAKIYFVIMLYFPSEFSV